MKTIEPELQAVALTCTAWLNTWVELPPEPWPEFVRLTRATTEDEIALVVAALAHHGRFVHEPAWSPAELADDFPRSLSGGVAVVGNGRTILPGCCCGLQTWGEWLGMVYGGGHPWTGHDPAPLVERRGAQVYVWSDGAAGREKPDMELPVVFAIERFERCLKRVANDLEGFSLALLDWLRMHAPGQAEAIVGKFNQAFGGRRL